MKTKQQKAIDEYLEVMLVLDRCGGVLKIQGVSKKLAKKLAPRLEAALLSLIKAQSEE